jgi:tRNA 2-thiocytidine biosynthesis protein TtcA
MISDGDRILLGLSGGKDSLAMLHVLLAIQKRAPIKFEIACATVDPQTDSFDPSPLIPYVQSLGVPYHYLSEPIVELAKSKMTGDSLCAFCSRFKRGLLYSCCRTHGYNKLVLAQHLDDLAESFIMSSLHNGQIRTMKANYTIEAGDVSVIRPFVYTREVQTRDFSTAVRLPIINEVCSKV